MVCYGRPGKERGRDVRLKKLIRSILVLGGVVFFAACGQQDSGPDTNQPESTRKMVARLQKIVDSIDPKTNIYANVERLAYFQSLKKPLSRDKKILLEARIAQEMLYAGYNLQAVQRFEKLDKMFARNPFFYPPRLVTAVKDLLAISWLRLAEQENCIERHSTESCLLPIQGKGIHEVRRGAEGAIKVYEEILARNPRDLNSIWLLNIAYMTLGQHPDGVPEQWRIPAEVFASDYDIKRFIDHAPELGIDTNGLAGGSVMEDFDNDGFLDIMVSSWGPRDQMHYYRNNGDGTFTERTEEAGLLGLTGGLNMIHADYNNDGFADVLVLRGAWLGKDGRQPNSLLRNNGDGTFTDVTEEAGLLSFHPTQTAAWGDFDNDGLLDLFIGNETVGNFEWENLNLGGEALSTKANPCELYRNNGDGTFTNIAGQAGVAFIGFVKGVAAGDFNNDGWLDIYLSRLDGANVLFENKGRDASGMISFENVAARAGVEEPNESFPTWFFDYDNDGWLDIFVSGYSASAGDIAADYLGLPTKGEKPRLYRNRRDGTFEDVTGKMKLDKILYTMGCNYGDLDNDGWLDFYVGTGDPDYRALMPNRMFRNAEGNVFQDVTTSGGFGHVQKGHGVAFGDLDNDGDQDVYAVIGGALSGDVFQNAFFVNPGHGNRWITIRLQGVRSNRAAIGARLRVRVQENGRERDIHVVAGSGGSFGSSSLQQEIGLGKAERIRELEILWPGSGERQVFRDLPVDQCIRIVEGEPKFEVIPMQSFSVSAAQ